MKIPSYVCERLCFSITYPRGRGNPFVLAFTKGDGGCDPFGEQTPSQWTQQDIAVASGTIGTILSVTGITELLAVGATVGKFVLPLMSLSSSVDDIGTNNKNESSSQQQTTNPQTKKNIAIVKTLVGAASVTTALKNPKETFSSATKTLSGVFDLTSTVSSSYQLWKDTKPQNITKNKAQHR